MIDTPPGALPPPGVPGLSDFSVFARGGYATVYRAVQQSVGREVAVKVENRPLESERDQKRFLREARAAGRMSSHPHVVDLFDAGVTAERHPYLMMELCGGSYAERMRASPLTAAEACDVGMKIADALTGAHALGVLHRDVKPANILYSGFGEPALADFGLAIIAESRDSSVTLEALTPAYAPPESFRHSPPTPAVDVYALCATLYAVMYGKPPRWGAERNPSLIAMMEMFARPIPDLPDVPTDLLNILRWGMANDPAARPSAAQLRDLLAAVPLGPPAGVAGPLALPFGAPSGLVAPVPSSLGPVLPAPGAAPIPSAPGSAEPAATRPRRRWWLLAGIGVLTVTAAGAGAWAGARFYAPTPETSAVTQTSAAPNPVPLLSGGGALPGCLIPLPGGGRCPGELECFDAVRSDGPNLRAEQVSCTGPHTWESYAEGDLPPEITTVSHATVVTNPTVRQVCSPNSFRLTTARMVTTGWEFEVLPPTPEALTAGDRTYRCLAGQGPDRLTGPTLTRD